MNIVFLPRDSIGRRFALTVVLAVSATWLLVGLFNVFGGVWAQPSLEQSGLLDQAADMAHHRGRTAAAPRAARRRGDNPCDQSWLVCRNLPRFDGPRTGRRPSSRT